MEKEIYKSYKINFNNDLLGFTDKKCTYISYFIVKKSISSQYCFNVILCCNKNSSCNINLHSQLYVNV